MISNLRMPPCSLRARPAIPSCRAQRTPSSCGGIATEMAPPSVRWSTHWRTCRPVWQRAILSVNARCCQPCVTPWIQKSGTRFAAIGWRQPTWISPLSSATASGVDDLSGPSAKTARPSAVGGVRRAALPNATGARGSASAAGGVPAAAATAATRAALHRCDADAPRHDRWRTFRQGVQTKHGRLSSGIVPNSAVTIKTDNEDAVYADLYLNIKDEFHHILDSSKGASDALDKLDKQYAVDDVSITAATGRVWRSTLPPK